MEDCAEGAGFWLPSEFFDDFLTDNENLPTESDSEFCFPTEFPYDFGAKRDENLEKPRVMSTSPQSTLTRMDSWPGLSTGWSSPKSNDAVGDLIYLAADQVAKLKLNGGVAPGPTKHRDFLGPPSPSLIHHVYLQRQKQGCGMWYSDAPMTARTGQGAWSVHQNPARIVGAGARAVVYGGGAAVKRECAGTGVFLPRRYGNNRPGASIPNRNVYSNQNSENVNSFPQPQPHLQPKFIPEYDLLMARRNAMLLQHRRRLVEGSSPMACTFTRSQVFID